MAKYQLRITEASGSTRTVEARNLSEVRDAVQAAVGYGLAASHFARELQVGCEARISATGQSFLFDLAGKLTEAEDDTEAASKALLAKLARSSELGELLDELVARQAANDAAGEEVAESRAAGAVETAMGHLRMALEAAKLYR